MTKQSSVYGVLACMPIVFSSTVLAITDAYVTDSNGQVVVNSNGECWRTSMWTSEKSGACDAAGGRVASVPATVPPAEPVAILSEPAEQVPPPAAEAPVPAPVLAEKEPTESPPPVVENINVSGEALFGFNQADIKPEERQKLSEVIDKIKGRHDVLEVVITGRADAIGSETYNQELSKKRAESVKKLLVSEGVTSERMVIQALGEDQPVASNSTADGRAQNRRVDIFIQVASNS